MTKYVGTISHTATPYMQCEYTLNQGYLVNWDSLVCPKGVLNTTESVNTTKRGRKPINYSLQGPHEISNSPLPITLISDASNII